MSNPSQFRQWQIANHLLHQMWYYPITFHVIHNIYGAAIINLDYAILRQIFENIFPDLFQCSGKYDFCNSATVKAFVANVLYAIWYFYIFKILTVRKCLSLNSF